MDDHNLKVPSSYEAEASVIGSMLFNTSCIDEIMEVVSSEDFFCGDIPFYFEAIMYLRNAGAAVDLVTVSQYIKDIFKKDCMADLAVIARSTPSYQNGVEYAKVVANKAIERKMIETARSIIEGVLNSNDTTDDKLDKAEAAILAIRKDKSLEIIEPAQIVREVIDQLDFQNKNKGKQFGLYTGFADMDKRFNGWREGDLIIIAGRPSMGKSTLAQNIGEHCAIEKGKPVLMFSLEMSKEDIIKRSMASIGGIEFSDIRSGDVMETNVTRLSEACRKIVASKFYIDDRSALSLPQVKAKARRMKRKFPDLSLIIIDYLQLMNAKADNREREIATISAGLKELAKELRVPILALSQLSRALEVRHDKRPVMSDLRESGAIEQDADIVIFIYRDEVYNDTTDERGVAHAITRKFRNGVTGTDFLSSEFNRMRFVNTTYAPSVTKRYTPIRTGGTFNYEE